MHKAIAPRFMGLLAAPLLALFAARNQRQHKLALCRSGRPSQVLPAPGIAPLFNSGVGPVA
jgi:hypothetical protein